MHNIKINQKTVSLPKERFCNPLIEDTIQVQIEKKQQNKLNTPYQNVELNESLSLYKNGKTETIALISNACQYPKAYTNTTLTHICIEIFPYFPFIIEHMARLLLHTFYKRKGKFGNSSNNFYLYANFCYCKPNRKQAALNFIIHLPVFSPFRPRYVSLIQLPNILLCSHFPQMYKRI